MSDDTPTQRIPQDEIGEELVEERQKSRTLMYILIGVGAVLIIAIIVLLVFLFSGDKGTPRAGSTPSPSPTPTANATPTSSPTPTATPTPEPVPTVTVTSAPQPPSDDGNAKITAYSISPTTCDTPGDTVTLRVTWKSTNGNIAYFGVNTTDAQSSGMGWGLPASGSDADFPSGYSPYQVTCPEDQVSYTITVVGNGSKSSKTVTLKAQ
jgi:predicted nucleic acid-binding Zn ribbon protein